MSKEEKKKISKKNFEDKKNSKNDSKFIEELNSGGKKQERIKILEKDIKITELGSGSGKPKIKIIEKEEFEENNPWTEFLSNPWKKVSFEAGGKSSSGFNWEDLSKKEFEEEEERKPINYMAPLNSENGLYIAPGSDSNLREDWKSEQETKLDEQKRLYSKTKIGEEVKDEALGKDYIAMKDFVKRDYIKIDTSEY